MTADERTEPAGGPTRSVDSNVLLGLIETHWQDIHHSRNQDWKFWVVLAGIGAGLVSVGAGESSPIALGILLAAGAAISLLAALISWNHTELHLKKTAHIEWLEGLLADQMGPSVRRGLPYSTRFKLAFRDRWFVSGIIFSIYSGLATVFVVSLLVLVGRDHVTLGVPWSSGIAGASALLLFWIVFVSAYFPFTRYMGTRRAKYAAHLSSGSNRTPSTSIFVAETEALNRVATDQARGLVKLVAPTLRADEEFKWLESTWSEGAEGKLPLLQVEKNYFEVSIATPRAPQEWHLHNDVYEIYISECEFDLETRQHEEDHVETHTVAGCAIVSPGVWHRVRLSGPTFVVQATGDGITRVSESKRGPG